MKRFREPLTPIVARPLGHGKPLLFVTFKCLVRSENSYNVQSNFNGSNTFGTKKISSRQGWFELMRVDNCARSGGIIRAV